MRRTETSGNGDGREPPSNAVPTAAWRGPDGRFRPGNRFAVGSALNRRIAELRGELFAAVSRTRLRRIVRGLAAAAETGDVAAAKLVLAYVLGKPRDADSLSRVEAAAAVGALFQVLQTYVPRERFGELAAELRRIQGGDGDG